VDLFIAFPSDVGAQVKRFAHLGAIRLLWDSKRQSADAAEAAFVGANANFMKRAPFTGTRCSLKSMPLSLNAPPGGQGRRHTPTE
jgi:ABC-type uncharacterized transport system involved in gliding motility auxiliary subunit